MHGLAQDTSWLDKKKKITLIIFNVLNYDFNQREEKSTDYKNQNPLFTVNIVIIMIFILNLILFEHYLLIIINCSVFLKGACVYIYIYIYIYIHFALNRYSNLY